LDRYEIGDMRDERVGYADLRYLFDRMTGLFLIFWKEVRLRRKGDLIYRMKMSQGDKEEKWK
jgi:hypothetical protein